MRLAVLMFIGLFWCVYVSFAMKAHAKMKEIEGNWRKMKENEGKWREMKETNAHARHISKTLHVCCDVCVSLLMYTSRFWCIQVAFDVYISLLMSICLLWCCTSLLMCMSLLICMSLLMYISLFWCQYASCDVARLCCFYLSLLMCMSLLMCKCLFWCVCLLCCLSVSFVFICLFWCLCTHIYMYVYCAIFPIWGGYGQ